MLNIFVKCYKTTLLALFVIHIQTSTEAVETFHLSSQLIQSFVHSYFQ